MQGIFWHKIHRPLEVKSEGFAGLALRHVLASAASPFDTNSAAFDRRDIRHAPSRRTFWPRNSHGDNCRDDEQRAQAELRAARFHISVTSSGGKAAGSANSNGPITIGPGNGKDSMGPFNTSARHSCSNRHRSYLIPPNQQATASVIQSSVLNRN